MPDYEEPPDMPMDIDYGGTDQQLHENEDDDPDDTYWSDMDDDDVGEIHEISHAGGDNGPNINVAQKTFALMTSTNK